MVKGEVGMIDVVVLLAFERCVFGMMDGHEGWQADLLEEEG